MDQPEYDSKGNVTKTKFADGTVEVRSYNGSNKLTVQETKNAVGALLSRYEYTYDENGNVTKTTGVLWRNRVLSRTGNGR